MCRIIQQMARMTTTAATAFLVSASLEVNYIHRMHRSFKAVKMLIERLRLAWPLFIPRAPTTCLGGGRSI